MSIFWLHPHSQHVNDMNFNLISSTRCWLPQCYDQEDSQLNAIVLQSLNPKFSLSYMNCICQQMH